MKEQYFLIEENDRQDQYPMIRLKEDNNAEFYLGLPEPIKDPDTFEFEFMKPCSPMSRMADYHLYDYIVFSEKIVDVLKEINPYKIEFLEAELTDKRGNTNYDYYVMHVCNRVQCFVKEKSAWTPPAFDPNEVMSIDIMTIDMDKLEKIPLEQRLIFDLEECFAYTLFHESVVDAILATEPTNIRFVSVNAWHSNINWEI